MPPRRAPAITPMRCLARKRRARSAFCCRPYRQPVSLRPARPTADHPMAAPMPMVVPMPMAARISWRRFLATVRETAFQAAPLRVACRQALEGLPVQRRLGRSRYLIRISGQPDRLQALMSTSASSPISLSVGSVLAKRLTATIPSASARTRPIIAIRIIPSSSDTSITALIVLRAIHSADLSRKSAPGCLPGHFLPLGGSRGH